MHGRDEIGGLIDGKGRVRRPWRPIVAAMDALGAAEFAARAASLDRRWDTGRNRAGVPSPTFDPLPVPLGRDEFATLAAGLIERAEFLSMMLDELYGAPDSTLLAGLSPEARFGSESFVRPLARVAPLARPRMALYAADVARNEQGEFQILRDHTDHVSGLGHALAIRRLAAEIMPDLFGKVTLISQRPAVEAFRDWLHRLAGTGPVGLLADQRIDDAGHRDGTAGDIAVLARHLGAMILRPGDLACKDGMVQLRTLAGATSVPVLLRMMGSASIDPLEQGGVPIHGVPGLFRCLRNGALTMLNIPGSRLLQDADITAFISSVFERHYGRQSILTPASMADRGLVMDRAPIVRRGHDGQDAGFDTAAITLRLFAFVTESGWHVLPGGLGIAENADGTRVLKDVWVIDDGEAEFGQRTTPSAPPWHRSAPPMLLRRAIDLPSRSADDLLWLGRMVERLDAAARLLAVAVPRFAISSALPHEVGQRALLAKCLVRAQLLGDELASPFLSASNLGAAMRSRQPLAALIADITRLMDACAERFSVSMRGIIDRALAEIPPGLDDTLTMLDPCLDFAATFNGVVAEDASRAGGFVFLELGRRLERAEVLAETYSILLDAKPGRLDPGLMLGIELADAALTHEFAYSGSSAPEAALALLIGARDYPRSLVYQTEALKAGFDRLGAAPEALAAAGLTEAAQALAMGADDIAAGLRAIAGAVGALAADFANRFFAPVPASHQTRQAR